MLTRNSSALRLEEYLLEVVVKKECMRENPRMPELLVLQ
jgi:hypothetical protein